MHRNFVWRCPCKVVGSFRPPGTWASEIVGTDLESSCSDGTNVRTNSLPYKTFLTAHSNYTERAIATASVAQD